MASMDSFTSASSDPKWYDGLKLGSGSCLDLCNLLQTNRGLIHELGPNGKTVLHKGVHHGCVKLVKFVLVDMFDADGNCKCKAEENEPCGLTREELLRKTDKHGDTAVNIVLVSWSPKMVKLLQWAIEVSKCEDSSPSVTEEYDDEGYSIPVVKQRTISSGSAPEVDDKVFIENSFAPITYGSESSHFMSIAMYEAVYKVIADEVGNCLDREWIESVEKRMESNVDFQFVPMEHIILHFLLSVEFRKLVKTETNWWVENPDYERTVNLVRSIIEECRKHGDWMVVTLFNILDPQGRTVLHAAYASYATGKKNDIINDLFMNGASPLSKQLLRDV